MKVLQATKLQAEAIDGYTRGPNKISFVQVDENTFIVGIHVLSDEAFASISEQLQQLPQMDYTPEGGDI